MTTLGARALDRVQIPSILVFGPVDAPRCPVLALDGSAPNVTLDRQVRVSGLSTLRLPPTTSRLGIWELES